jgi:hypothetical protein
MGVIGLGFSGNISTDIPIGTPKSKIFTKNVIIKLISMPANV